MSSSQGSITCMDFILPLLKTYVLHVNVSFPPVLPVSGFETQTLMRKSCVMNCLSTPPHGVPSLVRGHWISTRKNRTGTMATVGPKLWFGFSSYVISDAFLLPSGLPKHSPGESGPPGVAG